MKVAIIGGGLSWARAPWGDPTWNVWAHASIHEGVKPHSADLWFEMHLPSVRAEAKEWSKDYPAWLLREEGRTAPVMVQNAPPIPPNSLIFPRAEVLDWLRERGATDAEYITSTGAWMIVYALYKGATTIGIWGMNYEEGAEYVIQRPCIEYWIGFARALGVKVYITPTSRLCRDSHVYGYGGHRDDLRQAHAGNAPMATRLNTRHIVNGQYNPGIPKAVKALIDEEREIMGINSEQLWNEAASKF